MRLLEDSAKAETEKKSNTNTTIKVIGKPKENKFKVGADLVTIPIDKLTISRTMVIGSIIIHAERNIEPAAEIPEAKSVSEAIGAPIGRITKLSKISLRANKCPSTETNITIIKRYKIWLTTGVFAPEVGST